MDITTHSPYTIRPLTAQEMPQYMAIVQLLSPALTLERYQTYLADMLPYRYAQVGIFLEERCIGLSGYWIGTKLYCGKYLEIDNFVILPEYRNKGIGKIMLNWLENQARTQQCTHIMLDAYVENFKAHHFYYREGFIARGFHYLKQL